MGTGHQGEFSLGRESSVFEDSPLRHFALGSSMSGRAELSLGLFHAGGGSWACQPLYAVQSLAGQELLTFTVGQEITFK